MRATSFENYVSTLSHYDNPIWKPVKSTRKPISAIPPLRLETLTQDRWAQSDKEKAVVFANHLVGVFQPHEEETDEELPEYLQPPAQPATPINPVSPKEIKVEIGCLHLKKVSGMDLITPTMLKELPYKGLLTYSMPYSGIYWPHTLKLAEIILIHKPGKDPKEVK
jgi:hypothetical protein